MNSIELDEGSSEIAQAIADESGKTVDDVMKDALLLLAARVIKNSHREVA